MSHRAFSAAAREASGEAITFEVESYPYTFRVATPLRMGQLILFSRAAQSSPDDQARALDRMLRDWLVPEDQDEWDKCLGSITDLTILGQIVNYIVEEATGRPTQAS